MSETEQNRDMSHAAWFPASTRPRSFEGTGRHRSDLLTPGQKLAKLRKLLTPYFGKPVKRGLDFKQTTMTIEAQTIVTVRGYGFCPDIILDRFRGAQSPSRK